MLTGELMEHLPPPHRAHCLSPLIAYLADLGDGSEVDWQQWHIRRIAGGANNLLYRATSDRADLAIKFTIRDARDRAGREFQALLTLQEAGLAIAPQPVLLDRDRYPMPVVVQTWLDGTVSAEPPATDDDWQRWLEHLAATHTVTPATTARPLPEAVLTMTSAAHGLQRIRQQLDLIPLSAQPTALRALVQRVEELPFPTWPTPRLTFCHGDTNIRNVVRRSGTWASVDWEYSGWGDPAFEIADLITHAAHLTVPPERWEWVIRTYSAHSDDTPVEQRIRVYTLLMLAWWATRLARMLYEVPQGGDQRLAQWPTDWQADRQAKYEHYLTLATRSLR
jgi:thiamine kinase-like enzyme